ncbi:hypothetical protein [Pseudomonas sp. W4I3]|nr:hypothetical protein [Pseudomonas sp. W4I3]MDQ0740293.1 hypothetical protein [Pseudomonas sp. W4I3]
MKVAGSESFSKAAREFTQRSFPYTQLFNDVELADAFKPAALEPGRSALS